MHDHFGLTGGAGSKIYHHRVVQSGTFLVGKLEHVGILHHLGIHIEIAFAFAYREFISERGALRLRLVDIIYDFVLVYREQRFDVGIIAAVRYVLDGQKVSRGYEHDAELTASDVDEVILVTAVEHRHHEIAFFESFCAKHVREPVRKRRKLAESDYAFFAVIVTPDYGFLVGAKACVFVYDVVSEIEFFDGFVSEISVVIFVILEFRSFEIATDQIHTELLL